MRCYYFNVLSCRKDTNFIPNSAYWHIKMTRLSVNINKVATLRNARGENIPDVQKFAQDCEHLGAQGITVHPRPDERHITRRDVELLKPIVRTELNIEGYPDKRFIEIVTETLPAQVTLVPDSPTQLTSNAGWDVVANKEFLKKVTEKFQDLGIRVSIFIDADPLQVETAAKIGADRVELYTKPYADNYDICREEAVKPFVAASARAAELNIGVNAGHDLNRKNLEYFAKELPKLDEVSIGHAIVSDALYLGIGETIRQYLACLNN